MSTSHHTLQPRPLSSWMSTPGSIPSTTTANTSSIIPAAVFEQDDTLSHIIEVANQDVEMRDVFPVGSTYLVIDTNVLIDQLSVIKRLSEDIEAHLLPLVIVIPSVVLTELDGLKNREQLRWFAQTASTYILDKVKQWKSVKVQARRETFNIEAKESDIIRKNDIKIFDCCCYFRTKGNVILASGDKNLCIECEKEHIRTISPPKRTWTSRDIAHALVAYDIHGIQPELFRGHEDASYRPASENSTRTRVTEGSVCQADEDRMDVYEEYLTQSAAEDFTPSHALDALHWQVIDHFSSLFKNLADRLRTANGHGGPPVVSAHAPWFRRIRVEEWTVEQCLDYFKYHVEQKRLPRLRDTTPPIAVFLLRSQEKLHGRRGRRGQDWSRQDWVNVAGGMKEIGERVGDGALYQSVLGLLCEMDLVFHSAMRPTGM
ncbi:PIN domain-containing protein [Cristinia sonorae]|uniref:PIN domain-containing protein n=1 Tax=Cristinia sonorae TaxID=1940300 RepID=A0A8K0XTJ8_9AGAR|nr:PIN domain-containing protein [Cristinia sonorae]